MEAVNQQLYHHTVNNNLNIVIIIRLEIAVLQVKTDLRNVDRDMTTVRIVTMLVTTDKMLMIVRLKTMIDDTRSDEAGLILVVSLVKTLTMDKTHQEAIMKDVDQNKKKIVKTTILPVVTIQVVEVVEIREVTGPTIGIDEMLKSQIKVKGACQI